MQLDSKDIEAIGRSRANRSIPKNIKNWLYGGIIVMALGFIYWSFAKGGILALGLMGVGIIAIIYANNLADKWRKNIVNQIMQEWRIERDSRGVVKQ